jgi:methyl-accepting chemotaxis protein
MKLRMKVQLGFLVMFFIGLSMGITGLIAVNTLTGVAAELNGRHIMLTVVLIIAALAAGVLLSHYIFVIIYTPINTLIKFMERASANDLTVRMPPGYKAEIRQLFNACNTLIEKDEMNMKNLYGLAIKTREATQNMLEMSSGMAINSKGLNEQTTAVSATAEEFSAGMMQSANALSTASSHISAVASSIEEINATISTVAAAAEETSVRVEQSSTLVDNIQNSIAKASGSVALVSGAFDAVAERVDEINISIASVSEHSVNAMNRMSEANLKAKNTNTIIQKLEAASKQINKIVNVISDIADQTNMLALNAAIEAAGAGEAGKGFMVVANEVKELAKQTAVATGEIADHIENMQKNMPEAVEAVKEITTIINGLSEFMNTFAQEICQQGLRSEEIAAQSGEAALSMKEISAEIQKISENALSVTKTVTESTKGVNEIAKSTSELVVGTREIAMNSERAANNINEISRTAKDITSGILDISRNVQSINEETIEVLKSADISKTSSEALLTVVKGMEDLIAQYKTS